MMDVIKIILSLIGLLLVGGVIWWQYQVMLGVNLFQ